MRKRIVSLAVLLLGMALLGGCRRELEEAEVRVLLPEDANAVFSGVVEEGVATGTLTFPDWTYEGTLTQDGELIAGRAEGYPWSLVIAGEERPGRYTGALEGDSPVGEGVFRTEDGAVFAGEILGLSAVRGDIAGLALTLTREGSRYAGVYDGPLANGVPAGEGRFAGTNAARQRYEWTGGWAAGEPSGPGELVMDRLLTPAEGRERLGAYAGEGRDGLPEGRGVFTSVDDEGVAFTYEGEWAAGRMEGTGELRFAAEDRFIRRGTFTAGAFTQDWLQALSTYGTCEPLFTLSEEQLAFLARYPELGEPEGHLNYLDSVYKPEVERGLTVAAIYEDPDRIGDPHWMDQTAFRVISVASGPLFAGGPVMTRITATESTYAMAVRLLVPGTVEGLYRGQRVHAVAVPLAMSEYTTVLGERKPILLLLVGDLYNGQ